MQELILVVDDDGFHRRTAERILKASGYRVGCLSSGEALLVFMKAEKADLVLLDLHMSGIDGFATLQKLRQLPNGANVPVLALLEKYNADDETRAVSAGAEGFVMTPFTPSVLLLNVRNTLELTGLRGGRKQPDKPKASAPAPEQNTPYKALSEELAGMLNAFAEGGRSTEGHALRTAQCARKLAQAAKLPADAQERVYLMGLLHDIGNMDVPAEIIDKPEALTEEETAAVRAHAMRGYALLKDIKAVQGLAAAARWHHEHFDGTGYPDGIAGNDIPAEVRLLSVADVCAAMSEKRSYRDTLPMSEIRQVLTDGRGTQFDPQYADLMLQLLEKGEPDPAEEVPEAEEAAAAEPEAAPEPPPLPEDPMERLQAVGFDTEAGLRCCLGDAGFYKSVLLDFSTQAEKRCEKLNMALEKRMWDAYRVYAHDLREACVTVGAVSLADLAGSMEDAAKQADKAYIEANHEALLAALEEAAGHAGYAASK
ncbi:MAG: response regulator [Oscillospiraceae bacterium]|nr:response regulator [Oscillospiraceae bacterium]